MSQIIYMPQKQNTMGNMISQLAMMKVAQNMRLKESEIEEKRRIAAEERATAKGLELSPDWQKVDRLPDETEGAVSYGGKSFTRKPIKQPEPKLFDVEGAPGYKLAVLGDKFQIIKPESGDKEPEAIRTLRALQGDPSLMQTDLQRRQAGAQNVSVDARQMGTIPPGYKAIYDQQNRVVRLDPIPGGPAERGIKEEEAKKAAGASVKGTAAQTVWEDAERSLSVIKKYGRLATGASAKATKGIPGTPAHQLTKHIESIQGNIGIDQLLKIKESGAGLGHIPQAQLEMLSSLLGKLDPEMKREDLEFNIKRIQEIYAEIVKSTGGDPKELYRERLERIEKGDSRPPLESFLK